MNEARRSEIIISREGGMNKRTIKVLMIKYSRKSVHGFLRNIDKGPKKKKV